MQITHNGKVEDFAGILMVWISGKWECVTRYDCAHGFAHRDVIGFRIGLRDKLPLLGFKSRNDECEHAIRAIEVQAIPTRQTGPDRYGMGCAGLVQCRAKRQIPVAA